MYILLLLNLGELVCKVTPQKKYLTVKITFVNMKPAICSKIYKHLSLNELKPINKSQASHFRVRTKQLARASQTTQNHKY
jgi:hypothetical protein